MKQPYILIAYVILSIVLFRPMNRMIRGKGDFKDTIAPLRWMLIAFALILGFMFSLFMLDYQESGSIARRDDAIFVFILLVIYLILLTLLKRLHNTYYQENLQGFRYRAFFKKRDVKFDEIARVKYVNAYKGGSGFQLQDIYGEKYFIPIGYFRVQLLVNYLFLNAPVDIYQNANQWIDLKKQRQKLK